ncbi:MAG: hypothetical protein RR374_04295 [Clostridia bacterium]
MRFFRFCKRKITESCLMVNSAFKNFYKNYNVMFVAMGIIYLAIIFATFTFLKGTVSILQNNISASYDLLSSYLSNLIANTGLVELFKKDFWHNQYQTVSSIIIVNGNYIKGSLIALLTGCLSLILVSCYLAQKKCKRLIRKSFKNETRKRALPALLIRLLITGAFTVLTSYLFTVWSYSAIFMLILYVILQALASLAVTKFVYFPNVEYRQIVNLSNASKSIVANLILVATNIITLFCLASFFNLLLGILLLIPMLVYNSAVFDTTVTEYCITLNKKGMLSHEETETPQQIALDNKIKI